MDDQTTMMRDKPDTGSRPPLLTALVIAGCLVLGLLVLQAVTDNSGPNAALADVQRQVQAAQATAHQPIPPNDMAFPPGRSLDKPFALSALRDLQSTLDGGLTAGDLRQDVALDFANQIHNLRDIVASGEDPRPAAEGMRQKVADRVREGSLTADRGRHLDDGLDHLEQAVR